MTNNQDIKLKDLKKYYDVDFAPSKEYLDAMPDIQNSPYQSQYKINRVGIHGFHMPLKIMQKDGGVQEVQAHITGTVSIEAEKAGANMSRILRTAYSSINDTLSIDKLCNVLYDYKKSLDSFDAHIIMKFQYRLWVDALRSKKEDGSANGGWQYYDVTFDVDLNKAGELRKVMNVKFIYSSACPCSSALSQYAGLTRGVYGIPHSQRSVGDVHIEFDDMIWIEDVIEMLRNELTTEVVVFCKREDEMAFAEKNGAQTKFVEDAIRYISHGLDNLAGVKDYKIICSHLESLHAHDAIAITTKGIPGSKFTDDVTYEYLDALKR